MNLSKTTLCLLLIVLVAFAARLYSAHYVDIGSDEMIYSILPLNIISAERLSTLEQAPLYFYLTDIGYQLFGGMTLVNSRIPSIVFGAAAAILIFLIAMQLFNDQKVALWSSFFYALSGYAIRFNQEMDMTAFFFSLLSLYFFIKALLEKPSYLYLSTLFLALAVLVKPIVLLFVPAYAVALLIYGYKHQTFIYQKEKWQINKKWLSTIGLCLVLALLVVSPVFIYNYLLYKEKNLTDYYFSVLAGVGDQQLFQGQEAEPWTGSRFITILKITFANLFRFDAILLLLGFLGIIFALKKEKYLSSTILFTAILLLGYLGGKMGSPTHYVWLPIILSIFSGYAFLRLREFVQHRFRFKHVAVIIVALVVLSTFFTFQQLRPLREQSIAIALHEYAATIPDDAVVVLDPRIYRGIYAWAFGEVHYVEGGLFGEVLKIRDQLPAEEKQQVLFYYLECAPGTYCGWKPADFEYIYNYAEQLGSQIKNQTTKIAEIKAIDTFNVYQGTFAFSPRLYEVVDKTHLHWYTPVGWKYLDYAADNYTPQNTIDRFWNKFGFFILYLDVGIALLSLLLIFFLLGKPSG